MNKVSIIVPVYNAEKYLQRSIESVLKQDYENFELILVDDGSKDNSGKIMDEYAQKDSRVIAIHKPNGGVSSTRNLGLKKATGDFIQFMDSDDWMENEATKLLVRKILQDNSDLVVGDFYRVVEDNITAKGTFNESQLLTRKEYADKMMLSPADFYYGVLWNKLYKKSIIDQYSIHMDENISMCEDVIFNLEYLLHVSTVSILTAPIYYYVKTPGSLVEKSLNIPAIIEMKKNVITYYSNFYKETLKPIDYIERLPIIYSYMIAVSSDALSIELPFMKKHEENLPEAFIHQAVSPSLLLTNQLIDVLTEKYLNTVGKVHDLEIRDCKVLFAINSLQMPLTADAISFITGINELSVVTSLGKLAAKKLVKINQDKLLEISKYTYSITDEQLKKDLSNIEQDCRNIAYNGMSQQEISLCEKSNAFIAKNIINYLSNK